MKERCRNILGSYHTTIMASVLKFIMIAMIVLYSHGSQWILVDFVDLYWGPSGFYRVYFSLLQEQCRLITIKEIKKPGETEPSGN